MSSDAAAVLGPTVYRLAHARGNEVVTPIVNRDVVRRAWRIVSPVETMYNAGKLGHDLWQAYERFESDWTKASAQPNLIAKYGERAGSGGTPLKHMTADAIDAADKRDCSRTDAYRRMQAALSAMVTPRLTQTLEMAVAGEKLEEIGRVVSRYTDRGKAIAVAAASIEDALCLLRHHYATRHGQSQVAP